MESITISLPGESLLKLQDTAARLGVTPEELARMGIEELLAQPDEVFKQAIDYVLKKNVELYRRLA